jgi:hypothetical protein
MWAMRTSSAKPSTAPPANRPVLQGRALIIANASFPPDLPHEARAGVVGMCLTAGGCRQRASASWASARRSDWTNVAGRITPRFPVPDVPWDLDDSG